MPRTPAHVLDYYEDLELDEQLLHGTAPDEVFGRPPAHPSAAPTEYVECPECHGSGEVGRAGYSINPSSGIPVRDPQCDETGTCPTCHGTGGI